MNLTLIILYAIAQEESQLEQLIKGLEKSASLINYLESLNCNYMHIGNRMKAVLSINTIAKNATLKFYSLQQYIKKLYGLTTEN